MLDNGHKKFKSKTNQKYKELSEVTPHTIEDGWRNLKQSTIETISNKQ